jgi:hypothetical protein
VRVRIVVQGWERVLLHRDGRFEQVLGPGRHRRARWRRRRAVEDADALVHAALQVARRGAVAGRTLDELLAARDAVPADVPERAGMVTDQPALLQLRTLQAVEAGGARVHLATAPAG